MAFLRKVKTASGATAVQIAVREGARDRGLEHLGSAHTQAQLAALMEIGRQKLHPGQATLDLQGNQRQETDTGNAFVQGASSRLLVEAIAGAWKRLGFDVIDDETFFQLVLAPTSKSDSICVLQGIGVSAVHLSTIKRSLIRAQERGYHSQIATQCFEHAAHQRGHQSGALRRDHALFRGREGR